MHAPAKGVDDLGRMPLWHLEGAHDASVTWSGHAGLPPLAGVLLCLRTSAGLAATARVGETTSSEGCSKVACRKMGVRRLSVVSGSGSVVGSAWYLPPSARYK